MSEDATAPAQPSGGNEAVPDRKDTISLIIRFGCTTSSDIAFDCPNCWTIQQLKQHITESLPTRPNVSAQRLFFMGATLTDNLVIKNIMAQRCVAPDVPQVFHLVLTEPAAPEVRRRATNQSSGNGSTNQQPPLPPGYYNYGNHIGLSVHQMWQQQLQYAQYYGMQQQYPHMMAPHYMGGFAMNMMGGHGHQPPVEMMYDPIQLSLIQQQQARYAATAYPPIDLTNFPLTNGLNEAQMTWLIAYAMRNALPSPYESVRLALSEVGPHSDTQHILVLAIQRLDVQIGINDNHNATVAQAQRQAHEALVANNPNNENNGGVGMGMGMEIQRGGNMIDMAYYGFRILIFILVITMYSSVERFAMAAGIGLFILFIQMRRNQLRRRQQNAAQQTPNVNNNNTGEEQQQEGEGAAPANPPEAPSAIQLFLSTCYSFVVNLITSLVPDNAVQVNLN